MEEFISTPLAVGVFIVGMIAYCVIVYVQERKRK